MFTIGDVLSNKLFGKPAVKKTLPVGYRCDLCNDEIQESFIDGRIRGKSHWANMCLNCFSWVGVGLGEGLGQMYEYMETEGNKKIYMKIKG